MHLARALLVLFTLLATGCFPDTKPDPPPAAPPPVPVDPSPNNEKGYDQTPAIENELEPGDLVDADLKIRLGLPKPVPPGYQPGLSPPPLYFGEEIDNVKNQFRAATWNVRQLSIDTARNPITLRPDASQPAYTFRKSDAILRTLKLFGIHIAALQEVYTPANSSEFPLPEWSEGYFVLQGPELPAGGFQPMNTTSSAAFKLEYCPIAFRWDKMFCESLRSDEDARVHWAECSIFDDGVERHFYFGCGHFSVGSAAHNTSVQLVFTQLDNANNATPKPEPHVGNRNSKQDNFILGMDANSNPRGHLKTHWERHWLGTTATAWVGRNTTAGPSNNSGSVTAPVVGPRPGVADPTAPATKVYKRGGRIGVTTNPDKQVIDFLLHSFKKKEICYIQDSLQVMDVRQLRQDLLTDPDPQAVWQWYHPLSDHLLVKGDFRYKGCT